VAFAIPHGIAADEEIPPEAGLFVRSDHGWTKRRQIRWCEAPTPTPYLWRRLVLTVSEGDGPRKYGAVR
jgi:hypothetical protein